ncbi:MAG: hypothetical protein ABI222_03565 [Opitutaceae bacterium]
MHIPSLADSSVPMLFWHMLAIVSALVPIVLIEAYSAKRILGLSMGKAIGPISASNFMSMLVAFPLLWMVWLSAQQLVGGNDVHGLSTWWRKLYAVTVQAPWLVHSGRDLYWMVPAAAIVMLIPAFFMSVWVERLVLQWFWKDEEKSRLTRFSFLAHIPSYATLVFFWGVFGACTLTSA